MDEPQTYHIERLKRLIDGIRATRHLCHCVVRVVVGTTPPTLAERVTIAVRKRFIDVRSPLHDWVGSEKHYRSLVEPRELRQTAQNHRLAAEGNYSLPAKGRYIRMTSCGAAAQGNCTLAGATDAVMAERLATGHDAWAELVDDWDLPGLAGNYVCYVCDLAADLESAEATAGIIARDAAFFRFVVNDPIAAKLYEIQQHPHFIHSVPSQVQVSREAALMPKLLQGWVSRIADDPRWREQPRSTDTSIPAPRDKRPIDDAIAREESNRYRRVLGALPEPQKSCIECVLSLIPETDTTEHALELAAARGNWPLEDVKAWWSDFQSRVTRMDDRE